MTVASCTLLPAPIYGQVPQMAGGARGIPDLLAVDRTGRLVILELKASQDIHLPLQGLDYWMHVKWHLERGEFAERAVDRAFKRGRFDVQIEGVAQQKCRTQYCTVRIGNPAAGNVGGGAVDGLIQAAPAVADGGRGQ